MIDTTEQPDPHSQPYIEPVIAPPPPHVKPPTLPTLLVGAVDADKRIARIERTLDLLFVAMCLVLLVIIVEAAMIGAQLGHMVR